MTPVLLAFDTSTEALAVALQWRGGHCAWNGEGGAQASASLLPTVQRLLDEAGLMLADLDAIAFGRGPGAFTGLRTACSVAQGLAFGADKPVLPIDSLLIVAEDARAGCGLPPALEVAVAMDARMGELYAARYRWAHGGWQALQAPGLWDPQTWVAACRGGGQNVQGSGAVQGTGGTGGAEGMEGAEDGLAWAGSGLALLGDAFAAAAVGRAVCQDRAAALLRLADLAWRSGGALPAEQALPLYLRDKVALTTAERLALKAGA